MATLNAGLIKKASQWREEKERHGGVVVFFNGEVSGWMNELRDPNSWEPNCIAIDASNTQWVAKGGNSYDGALEWVELTLDKTNRAIKITRRMTEIEEFRANDDLSAAKDEELSIECGELEEELEALEVAN